MATTAEVLAKLEAQNIAEGNTYKRQYAGMIGSSMGELKQLDSAANQVPQYYLNRERGMMSDSSPLLENPKTTALMNKPTYEELIRELQMRSFQGK